MNETLIRLANEIRLACQLVSHKVRFESGSSLPPQQLSILFRLRKKSLSPSALAEAEGVTAPSITKAIALLEKRGCVERADDPDDGRRCFLSITDEGLRELEDAASVRDSFMEQRIRDLNPVEREVLAEAAKILRRVVSE